MDILSHSMPLWLELISIALCTGILVFFLYVLSEAENPDPRPQNRLWLFFFVSVAAAMAGSVINLFLRVGEMSGETVISSFPMVPTVLFKTHSGHVWLIRIVCLVLMLVAGKIRKIRDTRLVLIILFCLGTIIAFTESASGHAADKGDFSVAEIMDWLHLLGALVWGGGLIALTVVILPHMVKQDDHAAQSIAGVAARFSRIAGIAVWIIACTAIYQAWINAGSIEAVLKSPYGRTVIAKTVLFFLLLGLGAFNRYISVPRLQEWAGIPATSPGIISRLVAPILLSLTRDLKGRPLAIRFVRSVRIEALLVVVILFCAALLQHEIPARHFLHLEHMHGAGQLAGHEHDEHMSHHPGTGPAPVLRLETNPVHITAGTPVSMIVHLEDQQGRPVEGLTVHHERILHAIIIGEDLNVFAHIHPEDLGPVTEEMVSTATFPLHFTFPKAGAYLVGLDFALPDGLYSKSASLSVAGQPTMRAPMVDTSREKGFGEYHVSLMTSSKSIEAGPETLLRFLITKNGRPVTDLGPFLGAPMHLAVVRTDLTQFIHAHGVTPGDSHMHAEQMHVKPSELYGPEIDAFIVFPVKGVYKIFCQVKHQDKVLLFDFMVKVN
ncbi:MAG TPA: CopD family protein [Nitrospirota bacterium]|nr:CopD family protein [Nitrospirota bacterium]